MASIRREPERPNSGAGGVLSGVHMRLPDHAGGSIANLMNEVTSRLGVPGPLPGLHPGPATAVPQAETYVVVVFDGLGAGQLAAPEARTLAASCVGRLDACFPTTTVVGLASLATGLAPAGHGILSHFMHFPGDGVVNALRWKPISGHPIGFDPAGLLPETVWERLVAAGREAITVQPAAYQPSPTTRLLYRGARFEPAFDAHHWVETVSDLARVPGRLIFAYWPDVDVAAHTHGLASAPYRRTVAGVDAMWSGLVARLPAGAVAIGTADHGHVDYPHDRKHRPARVGVPVFGDPRVLMLRGADGDAAALAAGLPAEVVEATNAMFGPGDHPSLAERMPTHAVVADRGHLLIPSFMDDRLIGHHGGLEPEELDVPLLVAG